MPKTAERMGEECEEKIATAPGEVVPFRVRLGEEAPLERENHRKLVREAFEISSRSLARYWGAKDDEREPEGI